MGLAYESKQWKSARRAVIARDDGRCQACGVEDGLHVHHIEPVRNFPDPNDAHYLENLVTLCSTCHPSWEGRTSRPFLAGSGYIDVEKLSSALAGDTVLNLLMNIQRDRAFDKFIIENPSVCRRCFRRVYDVSERPMSYRRRVATWISDTERWPTPDANAGYIPKQADRWGQPSGTSQKVTFCECGFLNDFGGWERDDPISREEAIKFGQRVVARLEEEGVLVDEDAFFTFLKKAKDTSSVSAKDHDIFSMAVSFGIKHSDCETRGSDYTDSQAYVPVDSSTD